MNNVILLFYHLKYQWYFDRIFNENDANNRLSHHDNVDNHDHEDFETIVFNLEEINNTDLFINKIKLLTKDFEILRIKGYLSVTNKPMRFLIQAVGSRVRGQYDKMWNIDSNKDSQLIFIAEQNKINSEIIASYLR